VIVLSKVNGVDNLDENTEKRTQAYQQYYDYLNKQQTPTQSETTTTNSSGSTIKATTVVEKNYDGDTYQKSVATTGSVYDSTGKKTLDFSAETKTKFVSDSPPDVTSDMSAQLFDSLDQNKDRLLESSEYSKESSLSKEALKTDNESSENSSN
jgi:4-aminobutyrate aminotransferase-like enzyme